MRGNEKPVALPRNVATQSVLGQVAGSFDVDKSKIEICRLVEELGLKLYFFHRYLMTTPIIEL